MAALRDALRPLPASPALLGDRFAAGATSRYALRPPPADPWTVSIAAMATLRYALRLLPADLYYYNYIAQPWDRDKRIRRCLTASDDTLALPRACSPITST